MSYDLPPAKLAKQRKLPRAAETYRAFRRNASRGDVWEAQPSKYRQPPPVRENKRDRTDDLMLAAE